MSYSLQCGDSVRNRILLAWLVVPVLAISLLGGCSGSTSAPTTQSGADVVPPELDSTIHGSSSDPNTAAAEQAKAAGEGEGGTDPGQP